ncbi:hypothetical protein Tco_1151858 [Tanacetum coccineum]
MKYLIISNRDDPIASLNKAIAFLSTTIASRYPTTNNQLRTSLIQETKLPFRMVGSQFSKCREDRVSVLLGEGHMPRQCAQPKMPRNVEWFKEKILLVQAQESGQTNDLNVFDSDCNEAPGAKAVLIANLSGYNLDAISEVPISDTYQDNYVLDYRVQEMYYSEQPAFNPMSAIEITSDNNIISYDQYLKEMKSVVVQNTTST